MTPPSCATLILALTVPLYSDIMCLLALLMGRNRTTFVSGLGARIVAIACASMVDESGVGGPTPKVKNAIRGHRHIKTSLYPIRCFNGI